MSRLQVGDINDKSIDRAQQRIMRAIALSRIVKPTPIAAGGVWIRTFYPEPSPHYHLDYLGTGFYGRAYTHDSNGKRNLTENDVTRMIELWERFQRFFEDEPNYRRITRALKYFEGGFHINFVEYSHIVFHAALESLICSKDEPNRKQVIQRLPMLVPSINEKQAITIYELCCDIKHAAAPVQLNPISEGNWSAEDFERYEATRILSEALREIFQRAITDPDFADTLADTEKLKRKYPIKK